MDLAQKEKKKKEEAGFDPLKASFLEKGLVAGGDNHSIGHRAIGQTQAHSERHHSEKLKGQAREFRAKVSGQHKKSVSSMRGKLSLVVPKKTSPRHAYMPHQLKKPDIDKPGSSKNGSGKEE
ncbi:MAG: hypothetical protein ABIF01_00635 [Candidatus Micrarchaeota archaeon]